MDVADRGRPIGAAQLYALALGAGAAAWLITALLGGRGEAWDSPLYWSAAYPLCIALAGVLGYVQPVRPWRWALAMMLVQPVVMIFTSDSSFGLLPLGLILFGVLALPPMLSARAGAWLRLRGRT
jgi:hypothetical protein